MTDVCIPVSLLLVIVIWGYKMDAMGVDADGTLVLVYGIVLIVATGGTCGYIALRMSATPTYKPISMFPKEVFILVLLFHVFYLICLVNCSECSTQ